MMEEGKGITGNEETRGSNREETKEDKEERIEGRREGGRERRKKEGIEKVRERTLS